MNLLVDTGLLILLTALLAVSAIIHFVFPPGVDARGWRLWSLEYGDWCLIQLAVLIAFSLIVLLHLILHWTWICGFVTARAGKRLGRRIQVHDSAKTAYGVACLITLLTILGALVTAAEFSIRGPAP